MSNEELPPEVRALRPGGVFYWFIEQEGEAEPVSRFEPLLAVCTQARLDKAKARASELREILGLTD
jgi:hypothetical protein